jgi:hypothetical protein
MAMTSSSTGWTLEQWGGVLSVILAALTLVTGVVSKEATVKASKWFVQTVCLLLMIGIALIVSLGADLAADYFHYQAHNNAVASFLRLIVNGVGGGATVALVCLTIALAVDFIRALVRLIKWSSSKS